MQAAIAHGNPLSCPSAAAVHAPPHLVRSKSTELDQVSEELRLVDGDDLAQRASRGAELGQRASRDSRRRLRASPGWDAACAARNLKCGIWTPPRRQLDPSGHAAKVLQTAPAVIG